MRILTFLVLGLIVGGAVGGCSAAEGDGAVATVSSRVVKAKNADEVAKLCKISEAAAGYWMVQTLSRRVLWLESASGFLASRVANLSVDSTNLSPDGTAGYVTVDVLRKDSSKTSYDIRTSLKSCDEDGDVVSQSSLFLDDDSPPQPVSAGVTMTPACAEKAQDVLGQYTANGDPFTWHVIGVKQTQLQVEGSRQERNPPFVTPAVETRSYMLVVEDVAGHCVVHRLAG